MKKRFSFLPFISIFLMSQHAFAQNALNFNGESVQPAKLAAKKADKKAVQSKNTKKTKDKYTYINPEENAGSDADVPADEEVTKISIGSKRQKYQFFSTVSDAVLEDVENGTPASLENAVSKLRRSGAEYTEGERTLIYICTSIMEMVWKSQEIKWEKISTPGNDLYAGAVTSAKNSLYDTNTGKNDFLQALLPSLVLCSSSSRTDYYRQAEDDILVALGMNPKSVLANYLLGLLYYRMGQYPASYECLKAVEGNNLFEINLAMAQVLNALGKYKESMASAEKLLVLYPADVNILKLLAKNAFDMEDYSDAQRYASLVLQQNPSDMECILFRARIFIQTGEYLKASSLLDVYAKTNVTARDYLMLRARIQKEWNKNNNSAVASIENALKLYPEDTEVVLYAAELSTETGSLISGKSGAELARQVLETNPENQTALLFLIKNLVKQQSWREAYEYSSKLQGRQNPSVDVTCTHIKVCLALRYNDEAWRLASALYDKLPSDDRAVQAYVQALVSTGRTAQASRFINAQIAAASSAMKSFFYYERSFIVSGETAQLADLRSSLIANPRNSDALFRMYSIYYEKKDYRKALYYLRQVVALNPGEENYIRLNSELEQLLR